VHLSVLLREFPLQFYNGDGARLERTRMMLLLNGGKRSDEPFRHNTNILQKDDRRNWYNNIALCMLTEADEPDVR